MAEGLGGTVLVEQKAASSPNNTLLIHLDLSDLLSFDVLIFTFILVLYFLYIDVLIS